MMRVNVTDSLARKKFAQYHAGFYVRYRADVQRWNLERDDEKFLRNLVNGRLSGRALMCNQHIRRVLSEAVIEAFRAEYETDPARSRYWVTFAWDAGVTFEREPKIDLVALRNIADHHLRRAGLEGFGIVEIDVWKNLTGEPGRRQVAHVHFIGLSSDPAQFRWKSAQEVLQRALVNSLGAPSVIIKPVRPGVDNLTYLAGYMSKVSSAAKNLVPGKAKAKLRPARLPQGSAARLVEVLSHIEAGDMMFAIGSGQRVSRPVQKAIRAAIRAGGNRKPAPSREQVQHHWNRIRLINGSRQFREPRIITRIAQRSTR